MTRCPRRSLIFLGILTAGTAIAQKVTVAYENIPLAVPGGITAPIGGDFTGDGFADLVVHGTDSIRIYPGDGKGRFGDAVVTSIGEVEARRYAHAAAAGDFNGDGKLDFVAFQRVFLGNGDGSLTLVAKVSIENEPKLTDFNGDGILDLTGMSQGRFAILLGSSDGKFCFPRYYCDEAISFAPVQFAELGDANLDGKPDVVALGESGFQLVETWLSVELEARPIPGNQKLTPLVWKPAQRVVLVDVTSDRRPDLVLQRGGGIYVAAGVGDGTFGALNRTAMTGEYFDAFTDIVVSDFNRDGIPDLGYALNHEDPEPSGEFGVFFGDGKGQFTHQVVVDQGRYAAGTVGSADWNSDGMPDLVSSDGTSLTLSLSRPLALSSGSGEGAVAPGSLATFYGTNFASLFEAAPSLAEPPTTLGGVRIRIDEGSRSYDARLLYVSPTQINFVVSPDIKPGSYPGQVIGANGVQQMGLFVKEFAPALFSSDGVHAVASVTASSSEFVVVLYGTGLGGAAGSQVRLILDGQSVIAAEAVWSAPEFMGLDLVRVRIPRPDSCRTGVCPDANVMLFVNGIASNPLRLQFKQSN